MELNRPVPDSGPPGRFAALRPVLRLAIRLTKARRGSTALIIGLLAVPLIAATVSLAVLRSLNPTHAEQIRMEFGEADMRMYGPLGPTADTLPQGSRVGILSRLSGTVRVGNSAATVPIVSTGGDHDLVRSRSSLSSGLWPAGADEAAVTSTVAAAQGVGIGQTIVVDGRSYRVVGIYQALRNRQAREVQVQRTDARATVSETLVALPGHRDSERVAADLAQGGATMMTHADVETEGGAATSAATLTQWSVIMIEIALLIGSVFAVIRGREARQARALGELGASRRQITAITMLRAVFMAVIGIAIGIGVGLVVAELARRGLQNSVPFAAPFVRISGLELLLLAGFVLLMTLAAALTGLRPISRERAGASANVWRSAGSALAITVVGVAGLLVAIRLDSDNTRAVLLCAGGALAVTGIALLGTEVLFLMAKIRGGPPAFRIGVRDLARHRTRTRGMMIAALAGLVGGTMAVLALTSLAARDRDAYQPKLAAGQIVLDGADQSQARQLADQLGGAALAPILGAQRAVPSGETGLVLVARPDGSQGVVVVAEPAGLAAFGIPSNAVQGDGGGQAFVLIQEAATGDMIRLSSPGWRRTLTAVPVGPLLERDSPLPAAVITTAAAASLGIVTPIEPSSWVLSNGGPLSEADQMAVATFNGRYAGVAVTQEQGWVDNDGTFRFWLNIGVIAFGVLACLLVIVLAEVERARTYGILHSLGCSPWLRRGIAVVGAVVLSVWFVVLATVVSVPLTRIALDRTPLVVNWPSLALNGVAVVAIAAIVSMRARTRTSVTEEGN